MRRANVLRICCVVIILGSGLYIVPWLRYRPIKDLPPEIGQTQPPPAGTKSFALTSGSVVYSARGTIPQEPILFVLPFFGSLAAFGFLTISLMLGRRSPHRYNEGSRRDLER